MAAAPAIVNFVGGTADDAIANTAAMGHITLGRNSAFALPSMNFAGTPSGVDARRVVDTGILPGHQHRHRPPGGRRRPDRRRHHARAARLLRQGRIGAGGGFAARPGRLAMMEGPGLAVVAVGGNALISDKDHLSIADQFEQASLTARQVADMIEAGWNVIVTHGNGPQMGFILRRSELSIDEVAPVPMDYAGADLQGAIGYMFVKAFRNEFRRRGLRREPVAVVTETLVDLDDPAFEEPTKPIGSHMDEGRAKALAARQGWMVKEDAGRGWRRVVPSPAPKRIVDLEAIRTLVGAGYVVIGCGGGGVPVVEDGDGNLRGVEAVIDKDLASSLLARTIGADLFLVLTGVERVAIHFNQPNQRWLDKITVGEAERYYAEDQFDKGSMGPKVRALIDYLEAGGKEGLITNAENIGRALAGETGTRMVCG